MKPLSLFAAQSAQFSLFRTPGPKRIIATVGLVNQLGNGMFITTSALFFTRALGLPVEKVAVGLTISGTIGLAFGILIGSLADRYGPQRTYLVTLVAQAGSMTLFLKATSFTLFVIISTFASITQSGSLAARGPLIRSHAGGNSTEFRSVLRSTGNAAIMMGSLVGGIAIQVNQPVAYEAVVILNAISFLIAAGLLRRLPAIHARHVNRGPREARFPAIRDVRYLGMSVGMGILAIQLCVLPFALPLWIIGYTDAPGYLASAAVFLNTLLCVIFQVTASRRVGSSRSAVRTCWIAAFTALTACACFGFSARAGTFTAVALITLGVLFVTWAEMWISASGFELSFSLAPARRQGQYTGLFGTVQGMFLAFAPTLLSLLCINIGLLGWLCLGVIFLFGAAVVSTFVAPGFVDGDQR
ncbi:MFS transporter [Streptomyces sp. NPDC088354]|uniref:MFS transporter n=1 Tax=Streptomyces sp. NPDC088354 TaxID=3365856 RepID=UPI0038287C0A